MKGVPCIDCTKLLHRLCVKLSREGPHCNGDPRLSELSKMWDVDQGKLQVIGAGPRGRLYVPQAAGLEGQSYPRLSEPQP